MLAASGINAMITLKQWLPDWGSSVPLPGPELFERICYSEVQNAGLFEKFYPKSDYEKWFLKIVIYECLNFIAEMCKYIIFSFFQKKYNLWNSV
jgi:hypothetical protein